MNCEQFDQIVVDLDRAGDLDPALQQGALKHAQHCPLCAARLSGERELTAVLRAVSAAAESEQAPSSVEYALLDAFRTGRDASRPTAAVGTVSHRRSGAGHWRVWAVAIATMLLLAAVVAWKLRPTLPVLPVQMASAPQGAKKEAEKTAAVRGGETQPPPAIARHAVSHPHRAAKHASPSRRVETPEQAPAAEAATGFYPLPYSSGLGLDEGWALVRVQVRRSSLAAVGVPVSATSADGEMLTADVVVGQDGLARGIRFVQ